MDKSFQDRVRTEKTELDEKIKKLTTFISGETFQDLPGDERDLLKRQRAAMRDYSAILEKRIMRFK